LPRAIRGCETDGWATSRRRDGMEEIDNQVANKATRVSQSGGVTEHFEKRRDYVLEKLENENSKWGLQKIAEIPIKKK
jgi:hypothetical protein